MKARYRISPEGRGNEPSDQDIAKYRDPKRLLFAYEKATKPPKRPLYKDPKAFLVLLLIVLLAYVLTEMTEKPVGEDAQPGVEAVE